MDITDFASLLTVARQQPDPQKLLFLFLEKSISDDNKANKQTSFNAGTGGELSPVMTLEKSLDDLTTFQDLVAESREQKRDWHIVLVAALGGKNGELPDTETAFKNLDNMIKTVESGGNISKYLAFQINGDLISFQ